MTILPILGAPKFRVREIRFPEDEISLHVRWTQFYLHYSPGESREVVNQIMEEALAWCADQFGPINRMEPRWQIRRAAFCIMRDTDCAAFRLRWC
jgi:hypothetical protein